MTSSRPTLPGTIPGLLRRCSPVLITEDSGAGTRVLYAGQRGVVLMEHPDTVGPVVALDDQRAFPIPCDLLSLDLSDLTGRIHVVQWLSEHPASAGEQSLWHELVQKATACEPPVPLDQVIAEVRALAGRTP